MLQAWLVAEGHRNKWLAGQLGVTESMVSGWINRGIIPVRPYRKEIERLSGGSVPEEEWHRS